jgi:hypothetical protein
MAFINSQLVSGDSCRSRLPSSVFLQRADFFFLVVKGPTADATDALQP